MRKEKPPESQVSFLSPSDALMIHMARRFLAEVSRIYETRTGQTLEEALTIRNSRDAYEFLRLEMESLEQEQLRTINLNTKNRIISSSMIYQGALDNVTVRIAEVFRPAIIGNAAFIIVAHNHPSGDSLPSPEDVSLTNLLVEAGHLLGVEVIDHLVIGKGNFVSMRERSLGFGGKAKPSA